VKARLTAALLVILLLAGTTACGPRHFRFPPAVDPPVGFVQEGVASWYGPGYHGKKTSSGEVFDQDEMTAAHMTFAFGTRVRVTMLSNGRSVVVRINDRGPFVHGRIIDLTPAGAHALGFSGLARVEVRPLG